MWIKKMKNSLTVKICLMISVLLMAASGLTYAAVAGFLPVVYSNQLEESLDELSQGMAETLNSYGSIEEANAALELFAASTELSVAVLDQEGNMVWPEQRVIEMSIESAADTSDEEADTEETGDFSGLADDFEAAVQEEGNSVEAMAGAVMEDTDDADTVVGTSAEGGADSIEAMAGISAEEGAGSIEAMAGTSAEEGTDSTSEDYAFAEATAVDEDYADGNGADEVWDAVVSEFLDATGSKAYLVEGQAVNYKYVSDAELAGFSGKDASAIKMYDLRLGESDYVMLVAGGMQPVNQAMEILRQIFPYIFGVSVAVSLLFALVGSLYLTSPIVRLSRISRKMAALDFSDQYTGGRQDEIGELGRNLNEMASNLSGTLKNLKLANDKLKSDIELERELERKRIAFFSAVSHELKTPITILKGHISGMLRGIGAYQDRDYYLQRSMETTEKMEDMVGELLTVSRMESNTFVTQITDLAELMRLQLADLTELMEERDLELEAELPEHLYAEVNSGMMEKVFRNFLTNAIRYTPSGEKNQIRIFLREASEEEGQNGIFCSVENTGVHIPEECLPRLFDAFYRVESSRSRKTGGSGLGLYIVRMALEQHGASYGVENTLEGVRFFFELC
ncbi:MAG: HAMP domain-containing sensor histidine kinase [Lachnospiraceae bacterium]|nr:HAMP domain-containing sensor histidine kinase [Lachnospiraceae bacterium]